MEVEENTSVKRPFKRRNWKNTSNSLYVYNNEVKPLNKRNKRRLWD